MSHLYSSYTMISISLRISLVGHYKETFSHFLKKRISLLTCLKVFDMQIMTFFVSTFNASVLKNLVKETILWLQNM